MFTSLRNGTGELVTELAGRLTGDLRLRTAVTELQPYGGGYQVELSDGRRLEADVVILATPAFASSELIRPLVPAIAGRLSTIRYLSTGSISLAYRLSEVAHPLNGSGIIIPRSERRQVNAVTWSSVKFDYRAPEGYLLLRVFFGGSRSPAMMQKEDAELQDIAQRELRQMMGLGRPAGAVANLPLVRCQPSIRRRSPGPGSGHRGGAARRPVCHRQRLPGHRSARLHSPGAVDRPEGDSTDRPFAHPGY